MNTSTVRTGAATAVSKSPAGRRLAGDPRAAASLPEAARRAQPLGLGPGILILVGCATLIASVIQGVGEHRTLLTALSILALSASLGLAGRAPGRR